MQARELGGVCMAFESMRVTARSMPDAKGDDKRIPILVHGDPPDNEVEVKDLPQVTDLSRARTTWRCSMPGRCSDPQGSGLSGGRQEVEAEHRVGVRRGRREVHGHHSVHVSRDQGTSQVDAA